MAELEKTVTSLRKQVKLGAPMFVFHGVMNLSKENLSQHFLLGIWDRLKIICAVVQAPCIWDKLKITCAVM